MVGQHLLYPAFLFCILLKRIKMLQEQVSYGLRRLELEWQDSRRGKDPQEHLLSLFELLDTSEAFIHPCPYLGWHQFASLLIPPTLCGDAFDLHRADHPLPSRPQPAILAATPVSSPEGRYAASLDSH